MNAMEKLARRICWLEFPTPPKHTNEAQYWKRVHPEKQAEYIEDAHWLAWMTAKIVGKLGNWNLFMDARGEQVGLSKERSASLAKRSISTPARPQK